MTSERLQVLMVPLLRAVGVWGLLLHTAAGRKLTEPGGSGDCLTIKVSSPLPSFGQPDPHPLKAMQSSLKLPRLGTEHSKYKPGGGISDSKHSSRNKEKRRRKGGRGRGEGRGGG